MPRKAAPAESINHFLAEVVIWHFRAYEAGDYDTSDAMLRAVGAVTYDDPTGTATSFALITTAALNQLRAVAPIDGAMALRVVQLSELQSEMAFEAIDLMLRGVDDFTAGKPAVPGSATYTFRSVEAAAAALALIRGLVHAHAETAGKRPVNSYLQLEQLIAN